MEIGSVLDGTYKILSVIGRGGMSRVYLAINERANKSWAVKEVRRNAQVDYQIVRQNLLTETGMLKRLRHPNLPQIVDVIEEEDSFFIVMDYVEGVPLKKLLEEEGPQSQERVVDWGLQLCKVLGYLHSQDPPVIYRDMKPGNVMLKPDGTVILIDFGTAREYKQDSVSDTTYLGTRTYAAPEQFGGMGQTDARTDLYCLGTTLYNLLTGQQPEQLKRLVHPLLDFAPSGSQGLEEVLKKACASDPSDRYQSADEMEYALLHFTDLEDAHLKKQKRRLRLLLVGFSLSIFCFLGGFYGKKQANLRTSEDYDRVVELSETVQNLESAILTNPSRKEAYLRLVEKTDEDDLVTREEAAELLRLIQGLSGTDLHGTEYRERRVLDELNSRNPSDCEEICLEIARIILTDYEVEVEKDRYALAALWLEQWKDSNDQARLYCEISSALQTVHRYQSDRMVQTEKRFEALQDLWRQLILLKEILPELTEADDVLLGCQMLVRLCDNQLGGLYQVAESEELLSLISEVREQAEQLDGTKTHETIQNLKEMCAGCEERIFLLEEMQKP